MTPKVSILIPHFQTPTLSLLCLRLLRQRTRLRDYETLVIDNGSTDGSGEMLRRLRWARVVRREPAADERPTLAHGLALNFGVARAEAPLILTIHTDTMVLRPDWLEFLIAKLDEAGPACGGVGSWKMETPSLMRRGAKWLEDRWRKLRGRTPKRKPFLRSHCALYRRDALPRHPPIFAPSADRCAGEELGDGLERAGFPSRFLPPHELGRYVHHLNHATLALNDAVGVGNKYVPRTRSRAIQRIKQFFKKINADAILADASLDL